jgi:hypothetical protein
MADFADRSLGIGYAGGSTVLLFCVLAVLGLWYRSQGSVAVDTVNTPKVEAFYWATITFSQTLGTALGDWMADDTGACGFAFLMIPSGSARSICAEIQETCNTLDDSTKRKKCGAAMEMESTITPAMPACRATEAQAARKISLCHNDLFMQK